MFEGQARVYILANHLHSVLYIGVTTNFHLRINEHKHKAYEKSFSAQYNCNQLVYYELFSELGAAFDREKQLKKWSRYKKLYLN